MGISGKGGVMGPRGYLGIRGLLVEGRDSIRIVLTNVSEMLQGVMKVKVGYEDLRRSMQVLGTFREIQLAQCFLLLVCSGN